MPKSCCCFSLKSGSTIIGILDIMGGIVVFILGVVLLWIGLANEEIQPSNRQMTRDFYYNGNFGGVTSVIGVLFIISGIIGVTFGSILTHGVRKELLSLMETWVVFRLAFLGLDVVVKLVGLLYMFSVFALFSTILGWLISAWLITVVNSHRQNILDGSTLKGTVHSVRSEASKPHTHDMA